MSLRVVRPGFLSTLQDMGRRGYQSQGVPVSGAMDTDSMRLANLLVGNPENSVVLEITLHGAEFEAEADMLIALAGGGSVVYAGHTPLSFNRPLAVTGGTVIRFLPAEFGRYTYLALAGGIEAPAVMNSRATYLPSGFGGLEGRALRRDDRLIAPPAGAEITRVVRKLLRSQGPVGEGPRQRTPYHKLYMNKVIRIMEGPEWSWFTESTRSLLYGTPFRPTPDSNRMGYRLEGQKLERANAGELISTAVGAGTIQCLPGGTMVVLMADSQTTGGYPRIAQVAAADLPLCAQVRTHEPLFFKAISLADAEALFLNKEGWVRQMAQSLQREIRGV